jgi:RNA polymerase sigma-70 factor (ECF subfamily)
MSEESIAPVQSEAGFERLTSPYRPPLHRHCRRLLGSHEDAEDAVQETYLRAWRWRGTRRSNTSTRAWLYRIATNVCFDALSRRRRRNRVEASTPLGEQLGDGLEADRYTLEGIGAGPEPEVELTSKETVELTYMAAIRHLSPRQQTVLVLREVLGHSARETAKLMNSSVASVNSAGQRARRTLRQHLPEQRLEWSPDAAPSERELVERYLAATERGDAEAVTELLCERDRGSLGSQRPSFAAIRVPSSARPRTPSLR